MLVLVRHVRLRQELSKRRWTLLQWSWLSLTAMLKGGWHWAHEYLPMSMYSVCGHACILWFSHKYFILYLGIFSSIIFPPSSPFSLSLYSVAATCSPITFIGTGFEIVAKQTHWRFCAHLHHLHHHHDLCQIHSTFPPSIYSIGTTHLTTYCSSVLSFVLPHVTVQSYHFYW